MADSCFLKNRKNRHISATVSSITTNTHSVLKSNFYKSKMVDHRQFEKLLNHHKSAMVRWITMKFGIMMHSEYLKPSKRQNLIFKNQDGGDLGFKIQNQTSLWLIYSKQLSRGQNWYGTDADWCILAQPTTYPRPSLRTKRYCSAVSYALLNFQ